MRSAIVLTIALAACTPRPGQPDPATGRPSAEVPAACRADAAAGLVGQQRSDTLGREALRLTGAKTLRWIPPGTAVTMDYRPDRLNIELDAVGRVTRFGCS